MEAAEYDLLYAIELTYWWHVGKRDLVVRILRHWLRPDRPLALLDMGCGTGAHLLALSQFGPAAGCDVSPEAVAYCHTRGLAGVVVQTDPDRLPFPDASFDLVTALDVIEHIDDDVAMLREIGRVLKPGGAVFITTPAHKILWSVHDESVHHKRRYSRGELHAKLRQAGYVPERSTYFNGFLLPLIVPVRWLRDKLTRSKGPTSDFNLELHPLLNRLFLFIFTAEWWIIRWVPLPLGLTITSLGRKPVAAR